MPKSRTHLTCRYRIGLFSVVALSNGGWSQMVTAVQERFYTVPEVADVLGLHTNTVYRMIKRGELEYSRVTRWVRVPERSLNEYMDRTERRHPESVAPKGRRPRR